MKPRRSPSRRTRAPVSAKVPAINQARTTKRRVPTAAKTQAMNQTHTRDTPANDPNTRFRINDPAIKSGTYVPRNYPLVQRLLQRIDSIISSFFAHPLNTTEQQPLRPYTLPQGLTWNQSHCGREIVRKKKVLVPLPLSDNALSAGPTVCPVKFSVLSVLFHP